MQMAGKVQETEITMQEMANKRDTFAPECNHAEEMDKSDDDDCDESRRELN
jgi:hypothetical protein